jgi:hypothetical protein
MKKRAISMLLFPQVETKGRKMDKMSGWIGGYSVRAGFVAEDSRPAGNAMQGPSSGTEVRKYRL